MKTKMILELEQDLKKYHKIILFLPDCNALFVQNFCNSEILTSAENIRIYMPETFQNSENESVRIISITELEEILNVYYMYEFSNRLQVIGKITQYGSLLNYIETGILSEMDVFKAVLHH